MAQSQPKLCTACKWYQFWQSQHICNQPSLAKVGPDNPVTGIPEKILVICDVQRASGNCGPSGTLWEAP